MCLRFWTTSVFLLMFLVNATVAWAADQVQKIEGVRVTYILPKEVKQSSDIFSGLMFEAYDQGNDSKMERLHLSTTENGFKVKRSVDSMGTGSGIIVMVEATKISKPDSTVVTLIPKTQETYQQGLIFPFPIPEFDLKTYLSTAILEHSFEVNSEYPADAIKANFDRLLENHNYARYNYSINVDGEILSFFVKTHPYRNGSKVVVHARLCSKKLKNGVINLSEQTKRLKTKIQEIVNS